MNIPRYHAKRERRRMRCKHKARVARIVQVWLAAERKRAARGIKQGPDGRSYWTGRW